MINLDKIISVSGFMSLFSRDFPYMPYWVGGKAYFKGDIVYYNQNFYISLKDANIATPTNTQNWQITNEVNTDDFITSNDILRAFSEAKINFNTSLFTCCNDAAMIFYYLAAHYLVIDLNNANNPLALGFMGFSTSKSVGSVSESYGIPQWILNSKNLGLYAQTGYGRKYLSLISPYLTGAIIYTPGATTLG